MDIEIFATRAGDMLLQFFNWGWKSPRAPQAGTIRALKREERERKERDALYASTPMDFPPSRQVLRASVRAAAKIAAHRAMVEKRKARARSKSKAARVAA